MLRDPDLKEFVVWFVSLLVTGITLVVVSVSLFNSKPLIASIISLASVVISLIWRRLLLSGNPLWQVIRAGIQEGLIWGGGISVLWLLVLFLK